MSLHIPTADGLLGTHVTWDDVETEMKKALKTNSTFGANKTIENIGDQKGTLSRVGLIHPNWSVPDGLPKAFVIKIASQLPLVEASQKMGISDDDNEGGMEKLAMMGMLLRALHNREVEVYEMLKNEGNSGVPITKIFVSHKFDEYNQLKAFIISEYFDDLIPISVLDGLTAKDIRPVLKSLAVFSALGEKNEQKKKFVEGPNFFEITFTQLINQKMKEMFKSLIGQFVPDEPLRNKLIELAEKFYLNSDIIKKYKEINEFLGNGTVLIHADAWSPNVLFTKVDGKLELKALIDYQTVNVDTPAQDVAKLFITSLSKNERRNELDSLLQFYYESFVSELEGKPSPYTFEQLKNGYMLFFPLYALLTIFAIANKMMHFSGENSDEKKAEAMDKIIGLVEDIVKVHEQNEQNFPEFFNF